MTDPKLLSSFIDDVKTVLKIEEFGEQPMWTRRYAFNALRKYGRKETLDTARWIADTYGEDYRVRTMKGVFYSVPKYQERSKPLTHKKYN